jgi:hypothetical protein
MLRHLLTFGRRNTSDLTDRRSGAPVRRRPDPMPRMRWYS